MSQSSPVTQRTADSLPSIIPHSKSDHGPRFSLPTSRSVLLAAAWTPFQMCGVGWLLVEEKTTTTTAARDFRFQE